MSIAVYVAERENQVAQVRHGMEKKVKTQSVDSSLPGQSGRHFADDFSDAFSWMKILYFDSNFTKIKGPIDNAWALVQVMAWRRTGGKPLSERILTQFTNAYMRH